MLTWTSRPITALVSIAVLACVLSACGSGEPESSGASASIPSGVTGSEDAAVSSQEGCLLESGCAIGDIGPGGGLVFLISGGRTFEMAPNTWSGDGGQDPYLVWCSNTNSDIVGATGTAVGTGATNTRLIAAACKSGAANAVRAYAGGGETDWFLPSKDELNAMCNYSHNPTSPAASTVACSGSQDETFENGAFGFITGGPSYWSSSQNDSEFAWDQSIDDGRQGGLTKDSNPLVRPVRVY